MKRFCENSQQLFSAKYSIIDVRLGSKCDSSESQNRDMELFSLKIKEIESSLRNQQDKNWINYHSRSFKTLLSRTFRVRMRRICFQFRVHISQKLSPENSYHQKNKVKMCKSLKHPTSNPCVIQECVTINFVISLKEKRETKHVSQFQLFKLYDFFC